MSFTFPQNIIMHLITKYHLKDFASLKLLHKEKLVLKKGPSVASTCGKSPSDKKAMEDMKKFQPLCSQNPYNSFL